MKFLVIQTAFLGDVILATSVIEKLKEHFPDSEIDFLLRKGNETLFENHPFIHEVIILEKKKNKIINLLKTALKIRKRRYDYVINIHRFASSGLLTLFSGGKERIGFDKNPFSFCYTKKVKHEMGTGKHETERNHGLIKYLTDSATAKPKLYPSKNDFVRIQSIINPEYSGSSIVNNQYICIAPASVWFTKQFPKTKWLELIEKNETTIFLIGSKDDFALCEDIIQGMRNEGRGTRGKGQRTIVNLCEKLSLLETAALMKGAEMNYVNDSAPLHIASSVNAPVTAIFCSTVPEFGFGPLSDKSFILQTEEKLDCCPCGLHGYRQCPKGHFKCAYTIDVED